MQSFGWSVQFFKAVVHHVFSSGKAAQPPRKRELRGLSSLILKARQIKPSSFYIAYLSTMAARVRSIRPVNR